MSPSGGSSAGRSRCRMRRRRVRPRRSPRCRLLRRTLVGHGPINPLSLASTSRNTRLTGRCSDRWPIQRCLPGTLPIPPTVTLVVRTPNIRSVVADRPPEPIPPDNPHEFTQRVRAQGGAATPLVMIGVPRRCIRSPALAAWGQCNLSAGAASASALHERAPGARGARAPGRVGRDPATWLETWQHATRTCGALHSRVGAASLFHRWEPLIGRIELAPTRLARS